MTIKKIFWLTTLVPLMAYAADSGYMTAYGKTKGEAHEKAKAKVLNDKWACGLKSDPVGPFETEWKEQSSGKWKVKISYSCKPNK